MKISRLVGFIVLAQIIFSNIAFTGFSNEFFDAFFEPLIPNAESLKALFTTLDTVLKFNY